MASVTETIEQSIRYYPGLYLNRLDALYGYFCDDRGYYYWQDGEIIAAPDEGDEPWSREAEERRYEGWLSSLDAETQKYMRETYAKGWDEQEEMVKNASVIAATVTDETAQEGWYPKTDKALIFSIPADVKPDWAEAAEEVRTLVRKHGWAV